VNCRTIPVGRTGRCNGNILEFSGRGGIDNTLPEEGRRVMFTMAVWTRKVLEANDLMGVARLTVGVTGFRAAEWKKLRMPDSALGASLGFVCRAFLARAEIRSVGRVSASY